MSPVVVIARLVNGSRALTFKRGRESTLDLTACAWAEYLDEQGDG